MSIVINIVLILISIVLIVAVLMQQGQRQGLGAIGGGAETFFGKNKAKTLDGRLQKITKIAAACFIVLAIVATIVSAHEASRTPSDLISAAETEVEAAADEAADAAEDVAEEASEAVEEAAEGAEEAVEEAAETVEEAVEEATAEAAE